MGQRANLFETARKTINIIKSKAASKHTYERNFPTNVHNESDKEASVHSFPRAHQFIRKEPLQGHSCFDEALLQTEWTSHLAIENVPEKENV